MGEKEPDLWGKVHIIEDTDGEVGHLLLVCDGNHTPSGSRKRADNHGCMLQQAGTCNAPLQEKINSCQREVAIAVLRSLLWDPEDKPGS